MGGPGLCPELGALGAVVLQGWNWEPCPVLVATGSCSPRAREALGAVGQSTLGRAGAGSRCTGVYWGGLGRGGWGVLGAGEVVAGSWEGTEGNSEVGEPWKLGRGTGSCRGSSEWGHWEFLGSTGSGGGEGTGSWGGTGRHWGLRGAVGTGRSTGSWGSLGTGGLRGAAMVTGSAGGSTGSCRDGSGRRALEALGSSRHKTAATWVGSAGPGHILCYQ